jgi:hypothetical protein
MTEWSAQISRNPFKLACPSLPTMMWSCTEMPSGFATSTICWVIWMSARDGVGSPEGWLCTTKSRKGTALIPCSFYRSVGSQGAATGGGFPRLNRIIMLPHARSRRSL